MQPDLRVEAVTGAALAEHIQEVARLRIQVFRDYPYLYDGDLDYEARYLRRYLQVPASVLVLARDGDRVVGAATGMPLCHDLETFQRPFADVGIAPRTVFYFGESVLDRRYRGRGVGVSFFVEREAHARAAGDFAFTAFCAVDRPADHPLRPADYRPLDEFWQHRGYRRHPRLRTSLAWREIGDDRETSKPMTFWLKPWTAAASALLPGQGA